MNISEFSKNYKEKMFKGEKSEFLETDPEFVERFENFAFYLPKEVVSHN